MITTILLGIVGVLVIAGIAQYIKNQEMHDEIHSLTNELDLKMFQLRASRSELLANRYHIERLEKLEQAMTGLVSS